MYACMCVYICAVSLSLSLSPNLNLSLTLSLSFTLSHSLSLSLSLNLSISISHARHRRRSVNGTILVVRIKLGDLHSLLFLLPRRRQRRADFPVEEVLKDTTIRAGSSRNSGASSLPEVSPSRFEIEIEILIINEDGYVDDDDDSGGGCCDGHEVGYEDARGRPRRRRRQLRYVEIDDPHAVLTSLSSLFSVWLHRLILRGAHFRKSERHENMLTFTAKRF